MEKIMRRQRLPDIDSVEELAAFWDNHDLTDFGDHLQEVSEPVFVRAKGASLSIELQPAQAQRLKKIARSKGLTRQAVMFRHVLRAALLPIVTLIGVRLSFAIGGAVVRNRIKRRLREAFRLHRAAFGPQWDIVINPRRAVLAASFSEIEQALRKVIEKCGPSS